MKNVFKAFGIIAIVAVIGFSMAACGGDDGGPDYKPDSNNPIKGIWSNGSLTVSCSTNTWKAVYPGQGSWSGNYTLSSNGAAAFTDKNGAWGTATVSGTTMYVQSPQYGSYTLTRKN
jgi:predicted small lipoprotein YifL